MDRRSFIALLTGAAAWPLAARAQQSPQPPARPYRLGHLSGGTASSRVEWFKAFMSGMSDLGYVEGQNLIVEHRHADSRFERLPGLARELIAWKPDALLVSTTPATLAAKAATSTVPIVMVAVADPLGAGIITSLSHPGGNITGVTNSGAELAGKRVEILKEIFPAMSSVAVLINPDDQNSTLQMKSAHQVADKLAVRLDPILPIRNRADLKRAFESAVRARAVAALRMVDPLSTDLRRQTVALAAEHRLPVIYPFRDDVVAGGLISYGTNLANQYRQAARFMHKIFRGAKPADIPVEQPTKFELVINLKTAKALAIELPPTLLVRADDVID